MLHPVSIVPWNPSVTIAALSARILASEDGALTVEVPEAVAVGAAEVVVSLSGAAGPAAGPLWVEQADPKRPLAGVIAVAWACRPRRACG